MGKSGDYSQRALHAAISLLERRFKPQLVAEAGF
jgi:hypothetical protein